MTNGVGRKRRAFCCTPNFLIPLERSEHYAASVEYKAYAERLKDDPQLWCKWSERYINWRQLEILGLMSKGNWA